jgi:HAD superfamily hydrolase (TIGR01509 family)
MAFRGVVLDVDGTLVDSNDAHAHAWVEALAENGFEVPFEVVRPLIRMGGDKIVPKLTRLDAESPAGKKITERRSAIFQKKYLPNLKPTRGANELLRHLRARGLKLVVASSAEEDELKGLLKVCGADGLIEGKTSSDDAERSKPDPDVVHAALEDIGLPPAQTVFLGDTPYDVEAARRAKVAIIALRCGGWGDDDLAGALAVYDDPADLLARYDASPLGRS